MPPKNHAEDAILVFLGTLLKLAQSQDRYMVRDAGAIAPIVSLMISGTGEVPARAAAVLRDLAQYAANRTAILEAGGVAQLVKMLAVAKGSGSDANDIATEAADALRCLCAGYVPVCEAIREHGGLAALVAMLREGHASHATAVSAAALSQIAQADPASKLQIRDAGGVKALAQLVSKGVASDAAGARKRGGEHGNWCEGKACEAIMTGLHELVREAGCVKLLKQSGIVKSLVVLILRAGVQAPAAGLSAGVLVALLEDDGPEEEALGHVLDTLVDAKAKDEPLKGFGWSRERGSFSKLKELLHAAAEKRLQAVEEGASSQAIQQAIEVGKAVELPDERLNLARATFDETQAKRKREKLAASAEERRLRKVEEAARKAEAEAVAAPAAEEEDKNRKGRRKEAVPSRFVKKGTLGPAKKLSEGPSAEELALELEIQTLRAMEQMDATLRERTVKRMVREGYFEGDGAHGPLAEYVQALGLLPSGGASRADGDNRSAASREARDQMASKALERRIAAHNQALAHAGLTPPSRGGAGDISARSDDSGTGSSYSGTTVDDDDAAAGRTERSSSSALAKRGGGGGGKGGGKGDAKGGWFGGMFNGKDGGRKSPSPVRSAAGSDGRRHRRRHRRHKKSGGTTPGGGGGGGGGSVAIPPNTPSFMLPLFSKLTMDAAAAAQSERAPAGAAGEPMGPGRSETWRKRWEEKYVEGGFGGEMSRMLEAAAARSYRSEAPPQSADRWEVVRERLPEVVSMGQLEA